KAPTHWSSSASVRWRARRCSPISRPPKPNAPVGPIEELRMANFPGLEEEHIHKSRREQRLRRFKQVPIRILVPNLITLLALCSGVTAIRLGMEGRYELAVGAVILAIVLDAIDGLLARFLKGTARFGAELDSLADFVNFGVAPAMLIYLWSLNSLKRLGLGAALCLSLCCGTAS